MKTAEESNVLENKIESRNKECSELDKEDLAEFAGGSNGSARCPYCNGSLMWSGHSERKQRDFYKCGNCGELTYFWQGTWFRGWIH